MNFRLTRVALAPLPATILLALPGLLAAPPGWAQAPSQEGLPGLLVIPVTLRQDGSLDPEPIKAFAARMQQLADAGAASAPRVGFLQNLFGSRTVARPVSIPDLARYAPSLQGQRILVEGLLERTSGATGEFRLDQARCLINLAGGAQVEGFPDKNLYDMPVAAEGTVETGGSVPVVRAYVLRPSPGIALLRVARALEIIGDYAGAVDAYLKSEAALRRQSLDLAAFARISAGRIAYDHLRDKAQADKHYNLAWTVYLTNIPAAAPPVHIWMPVESGKQWQRMTIREAIADTLDSINSESFWYKFVAFFVALCGGNAALGCLLIALVVRLIIWPLTKKQLQSAEAMKRLQPQIKELQTRFADDKQKFQQEFWKLCQANGVNPLGGCLPLLIQMPILIMVYKGIRLYIVQFDKASFLWVPNLAGPDMILLIAYTVSMILFQKMTQATSPQAMDPQQEQQQKMMMYMMPVMFFFMFKTFPAAFILYWLGTNIIYFLQQWGYTRSLHAGQQAPHSQPQPRGLVARIARLLSGEPAAQDPASNSGPAHNEPIDTRSLEQIKKSARTDRRTARKGRKR